MKTITILGANGRLSNMAAKAFYRAGYHVVAITRTGTAKGLPAAIEQRSANALDRQSLVQATHDSDFIFNGLNPIYTQWKKNLLPMGENVMAACREHGAIHLFPGNVYNYGHKIPPLVKDDTAISKTTRKGTLRCAVEDYFRQQSSSHGVQTIILRAGDFYGGKMPGSWFDLAIAAKMKKGVFTYPGPMNVVHSWAYLPDLADSFVQLAAHADELSPFEQFLFPGHAMTGNEMKHHCEVAIGADLKRANVPWLLFRLGAMVVPMLREVCEMSYLWQEPHALDGHKLEVLIGAIPATDPQIAIATALAELGVIAPVAHPANLPIAV